MDLGGPKEEQREREKEKVNKRETLRYTGYQERERGQEAEENQVPWSGKT
jgi:hypothetical protein